MPDIREVLDRAAPSVSEVDITAIDRRARRRQRGPRLVAAAVVVAVAATGVVFFTARDDSTRRIESGTTPPTAPAPTATADVRSSDPALRSKLRRCTADDLRLSRTELLVTPDLSAVNIFFAPNDSSSCALLSYPEVEGQRSDGTWEKIPMAYEDRDAISSFPWEGVFAPAAADAPPPAGLGVVARLSTRPSSSAPAGACMGSASSPPSYTSVRFVLRDGGGTVPLEGVQVETNGCENTLTRFGFESSDGAGLTAPTTLPAGEDRLSSDSKLGYAGLGPIKLGMSLDEAVAAGRVEFVNTGCDDTVRAEAGSGLDPSDGISVSYLGSSPTVQTISVTTPKIFTISGIHVGSTLDEVLATYPDAVVGAETVIDGYSATITSATGRVITFWVEGPSSTVYSMHLAQQGEDVVIDPRC